MKRGGLWELFRKNESYAGTFEKVPCTLKTFKDKG
jgi:hypothetical protein